MAKSAFGHALFYSGVSGYSGGSGYSGMAGAAASSGYSGVSGPSGISGYSGVSGPLGESGYSGVSGALGESGYSGSSGSSGVSGYSSLSGVSGFSGAAGGNAGRIYYLDIDTASDIGGAYKVASLSPSAGAETTGVQANTGTGDTLIGTFATISGEPGSLSLPAGTAVRHIHGKVDAGEARYLVEIYKRDTGGTETLLRTGYSNNFSNTTVEQVEWYFSDATSNALLASDRIIFKLYTARVSGPTTVTVTTYYNGTDHPSFVQTTISSGAVGPQGISGYSGMSGYSSLSGTSGSSGESGISGYSGGSGVSGYSGTSGTIPNPLAGVELKDIGETIQVLGSGSGARTLNIDNGNVATATATGASTWTFSNPFATGKSCTVSLILTNGGTGAQTFPNIKWPGGVAPTLTVSGVDILIFNTIDAGTTWRGVLSGANFS